MAKFPISSMGKRRSHTGLSPPPHRCRHPNITCARHKAFGALFVKQLTARLMDKAHVIWDWNGTIVDDVDICVEVISELRLRFGLPEIDKDDYLKKFRFPVNDYYHEIGFTKELVDHKDLSKLFISHYTQKLSRLKLFHGITDVFDELKSYGIKQSILSAAHESDLQKLLVHFRLEHHFTYVYGLNNHDAHSKVQRGQDLIKQIHEPLSKLVLIGDTLHDREVAEQLGIDVIILSHGHQHPDRMKPWAPLFHKRYS
jgi:phosphoglycolate phosphatase